MFAVNANSFFCDVNVNQTDSKPLSELEGGPEKAGVGGRSRLWPPLSSSTYLGC